MKHGAAIENGTGLAGAGFATGVVEPGMSLDEAGQIVGIIYCSFLIIKMTVKAIICIKSKLKRK